MTSARAVQSGPDGLPFSVAVGEGVAGTASSPPRLLTRHVPELRVRELTARECFVIRAFERGEPMKAIAVDLAVSINSVRAYTTRAYRKLGVASQRDAVRRHRRLHDHQCSAEPLSVAKKSESV